MLTFLKKIFKNNNSSQSLVLIVEDNEVDRQFAVKTISRGGYRTETADNGQSGLEKAGALKPDLILLDCEMPVMGGLEMCRKLRQVDSLKQTPVIFLTGLDTPKNIIDCFETDAENYLSKPVNGRLLINEIHKILVSKT